MDQETICYQQKWDRGTVLENDKANLVCDLEFRLRKTTTARRPGLILDIVYPKQNNIDVKRVEKMMKCRQIAFETRERRPDYKVYVVSVVVGALGAVIKALRRNYCYDAKVSINGQRKYYSKSHIWSYPRTR